MANLAKFSHANTTITCGRKTVASAGTAEALVSSYTYTNGVAITAETDNTGIVVVGDSSVVAALATRKGIPLSPGDTLILDVHDLNLVYLDVTVATDGVTYTAVG